MCKFDLALEERWTDDMTSSGLCQTRVPGAHTMRPALSEAVFGGRTLGDGNKTSTRAKLVTADRGAGWDLAARETPWLQLSKQL